MYCPSKRPNHKQRRMIMVHTLAKQTLREILADTIRDSSGLAPGALADAILATLHIYAPKSYVDERIDLDSDSKYTAIAKEMILAHAFDIADWEVAHAYPRLSSDEIAIVGDLIGQSSVTVEF
jgi:hypothetical protein